MIDTFKLETAACLWEAALTMLDSNQGQHDHVRKLQEYREAWGMSDLRLTIIGLTDECDAAWKKVEDTYDACFDWDFVPCFLQEKVEQWA